ncbi:ABZJ_00895 family protein [Bordetella genomosp. 13]|uniref:ABZJ_00895 family protein n=1 Tax=Bordetella genomosp. 13 TaxID=463040 RepID=UPI0011A8BD47|nr:ABZJ_00895 family protein [Bordetella genomosp. 13]
MSIPKLLLRFALIYVGLLVGLTVVLLLLHIASTTPVRIVALLTATMAVCQSFAKHNGRYFNSREKLQAIGGMVLIDLVLQLGATLLAFQQAGLGGDGSLHVGAFVAVIGFFTLIDVLVILFFVWFIGRQHAKEQARIGGTAP